MHALREELQIAKEIILRKESIHKQAEAAAARKLECEHRLEEMENVIAKARKDIDARLWVDMKSGPIFTLIGLALAIFAFLFTRYILTIDFTIEEFGLAALSIVIAPPPLLIGLLLIRAFFRSKKKSAVIYADTMREKETFRFSTAGPEIERCNREIANHERSIQYLETQNEEALSLLPKELQDSASIDSILRNLETEKAEGLASAISLCILEKEIASLKSELESAQAQLKTTNDDDKASDDFETTFPGIYLIGKTCKSIFDHFIKK